MVRHSKNNTSSAVFTYAERQMIGGFGTQKMVVGRDSLRNYDACCLCLQTAREPLSCNKGHLACKECIYENILSQRKEIAHQQKQAELNQQKQKTEKIVTNEIEKEAEKLAFIAQQDNLIPTASASSSSSSNTVKQTPNSFWIPSMAPEAKQSQQEVSEEKRKTEIVCPLGQDHQLSIKKLIPVTFTKSSTNSSTSDSFVCPSCRKELSNAMTLVFPKQCGHVICKNCYNATMSQQQNQKQKCFVCDGKVKEMIELSIEGTGYSSKGGVQVEKYEVAFKV